MSSELMANLYAPAMVFVARLRLQEYAWGSLRKTMSGTYLSRKCLRLKMLRLMPSIFHDIEVYIDDIGEDLNLVIAPAEVAGLSGLGSLKATEYYRRYLV